MQLFTKAMLKFTSYLSIEVQEIYAMFIVKAASNVSTFVTVEQIWWLLQLSFHLLAWSVSKWHINLSFIKASKFDAHEVYIKASFTIVIPYPRQNWSRVFANWLMHCSHWSSCDSPWPMTAHLPSLFNFFILLCLKWYLKIQKYIIHNRAVWQRDR